MDGTRPQVIRSIEILVLHRLLQHHQHLLLDDHVIEIEKVVLVEKLYEVSGHIAVTLLCV